MIFHDEWRMRGKMKNRATSLHAPVTWGRRGQLGGHERAPLQSGSAPPFSASRSCEKPPPQIRPHSASPNPQTQSRATSLHAPWSWCSRPTDGASDLSLGGEHSDPPFCHHLSLAPGGEAPASRPGLSTPPTPFVGPQNNPHDPSCSFRPSLSAAAGECRRLCRLWA